VKIKSGKRKQLRLELDKDIFKSFSIIGTSFEGSRIVDISHYGMGIMFKEGINNFTDNQIVYFSLKFDSSKVDFTGIVRHAGSKFVGIEFTSIKNNKDKFYNYLDSRIIKKFKIPVNSPLRGLLVVKIDIKLTILLMILEAILLIGGFCLYNNFKKEKESFDYLKGNNHKIEKTIGFSA
jgi:hypothetical protein